jgi:hypothetical protein
LFPPTEVVFLSETTPEGMPEIGLEDVPESAIGRPGDERVIWDANEDTPRIDGDCLTLLCRMAALSSQHSVMRIAYAGETSARLQLEFNEDGGRAPITQGPFVLSASKGESATFDVPLYDTGAGWMRLSITAVAAIESFQLDRVSIVPDLNDESDRLEVLSRKANEVSVGLNDLPGPRMLLYVDSAFPGWEAYIDGEPTAIHLANDAFKAVAVPAGSHTVTFRFRPRRVFTGIALSCVALTVSLTVIAVCLYLERRRKTVAPTSVYSRGI